MIGFGASFGLTLANDSPPGARKKSAECFELREKGESRKERGERSDRSPLSHALSYSADAALLGPIDERLAADRVVEIYVHAGGLAVGLTGPCQSQAVIITANRPSP